MSLSMSVQLDQYALQRLASINDIRAMLQNRIIPEVSVLVKKLEDEAKKKIRCWLRQTVSMSKSCRKLLKWAMDLKR